MRVAMLTGGGDCPGLNPALRGFVLRGIEHGFECLGFLNGWRGMIECRYRSLERKDVEDVILHGGTMLGTSRTNPFSKDREADLQKLLSNLRELEIDAVAAFGGDDTLGVAYKLHQIGIKTVGVPKTMDNDLDQTDYTFGFDSAVSVATESIDRLRDTAKSHNRVMVVEVMGRLAGWVALYSGIAGGADYILIPEVKPDIEGMCDTLLRIRGRGREYAIVVVSEGIDLPAEAVSEAKVDEFQNVIQSERGVGDYIAKVIEKKTHWETRHAVLGHVVRGGPPSVFDRVLASRLGIRAADLVHEGAFGQMASIQGNRIVAVDLKDAVGSLKRVPRELYEEASVLFSR